jgi:hypothetical protein
MPSNKSSSMVRTTLVAAGLFVVAFALTFLLPKETRMEDA